MEKFFWLVWTGLLVLLGLILPLPIWAVNIIGYTEQINCQTISGWTCDKDNPNEILSAHLYIDGNFVLAKANSISRPDTDGVCGVGNNLRGFEMNTPFAYADGQNHIVKVYGVVADGSSRELPLSSNLSTNIINCVDSSRIVKIGIGDSVNGFTIVAAEAIDGQIIDECSVGSNLDDLNRILQWRNSQSLCSDTGNSSTYCSGANIAKETSVSRFCYWKDRKEIQTSVNNLNQPYSGCLIHDTEEKKLNPGGYSVYLSRNVSVSQDKGWQNLGNLSKIKLVTGYRTDYFNEGTCPSGVSDPIFGTTKAAFAYMNVIVNQLDKITKTIKTTVFFQTVLYDNRIEWQNGTASYKDCNQSGTTNFVVVGLPISSFGMSMALPGENLKQYEWDILPKIKTAIEDCLGSVDYNDFVISNMFLGNELIGPVVMTNSFVNPHAELVLEPDYIDENVCNVGDGNSDGSVDITDLVNWYKAYKGTYDKDGDLNCDGKIDIKDLIAWYGEYRS